jgi:uncharacterized membrane protein YciS (DUF1049 family)
MDLPSFIFGMVVGGAVITLIYLLSEIILNKAKKEINQNNNKEEYAGWL